VRAAGSSLTECLRGLFKSSRSWLRMNSSRNSSASLRLDAMYALEVADLTRATSPAALSDVVSAML
jgi:hypothetical protein